MPGSGPQTLFHTSWPFWPAKADIVLAMRESLARAASLANWKTPLGTAACSSCT